MVYRTLAGQEIADRTARELKQLYDESRGEHFAGRLWREVLTEDERLSLGGNFVQAYLNEHRAVGMYRSLYGRLSFERALLEMMRHVGWLAEARYERLLDEIGETRLLSPGRGGRPVWTGKCLFLNGEEIRTIRQPKKSHRAKAILDAFERHGWPSHLKLEEVGAFRTKELSDALRRLNDGLKRIKFSMDGSATGIVWRLR